MAQSAICLVGDMPAEPTLDRRHLARMTLGDRALERELLELFDRQAAILLARMYEADAVSMPALAHTLKGSASGIGAGAVAEAARIIEQASSPTEQMAAVERLASAIAALRPVIVALLQESAS
jgi:HPt (histidine-containing phosphotransfer) domain-containing protein